MKKIYENIRNLREDHDLKQKDVAEFLQISRSAYNHYERGNTCFTADMIVDLSHFFKTTPNVLLDFQSENEITDPKLLKLCNYIKKENIDVDALINLIKIAHKL